MKVLILYSGGKDSQACLIWAVKEYGLNNCEAVFCDTGWENPVTYEHIKTTCQQMGVKLVTIKSKKYDGLVDMSVKRKRFPSTKARFCTVELKSKPTIDYVLLHNENIIVIEGIRAQESFSRRQMKPQCTYFKYYFEPVKIDKNGKEVYHTYRKKDIIKWCKIFNADKIRPIFDWSAQQTIQFIRENDQQPNPLYFMGFQRVGCFPCIMSRHQATKLIIDNHPEQWQVLKDAEIKVGRTFFPPDYIPKRATANKRFPTAQDVEKYMKDTNETIDMFEGEQPGCMSAYNLCE
jgi:3'-phosphoadenosine 5'-phosphosulfate sulfotransferase (PAPS reductase)/FAD synthetase